MKTALYLATAMIIFYSTDVKAQADVTQSRWTTKSIVADGANADWKKPLQLYDAVTGLLFSIENDSTHLYLCFTNNDERKITKMMKAGWDVEIFSKEKNKKFNAAIHFPAVQMIDAPGKDGGISQSEGASFKSEVALYRLNLQAIGASGFLGVNDTIAMQNNNGINIGIGSDSTQAMIYEIAIPFSTLLTANQFSLHEEMGLHITIHHLKKPAYHGDPDGKDLVGKQKGRNGVSKGAMENSPYPVDRSLLYTEVDFKQKFALTAKSAAN